MTVRIYGVPPSIDKVEWSQLFADMLAAAPAMEVVSSGLVVTASAGTRTVSISAGRAAAAGVLLVSDAAETRQLDSAAAGTARADLIVARINWSNNTGAIEVVKGVALAGDDPQPRVPVRTPGTLWQVPLGYVVISSTSGALLARDINRGMVPVPSTGRVATDPAGGWTLPAAQPLTVLRRAGKTELNGRLERTGSNLSVGEVNDFGGLRLMPEAEFNPRGDREICSFCTWDPESTQPGIGLLRISPLGFAQFAAVNKTLTTGRVVRIHETWEN